MSSNRSSFAEWTVESLQVVRIQWKSRLSYFFQKFIDTLLPDPSTSALGRIIQLVEVGFVALLALLLIVFQSYSDNSLTVLRIQRQTQFEELESVTFELYDLSALLMDEMQPFYEFNTGDYEQFFKVAEKPMRTVDHVRHYKIFYLMRILFLIEIDMAPWMASGLDGVGNKK